MASGSPSSARRPWLSRSGSAASVLSCDTEEKGSCVLLLRQGGPSAPAPAPIDRRPVVPSRETTRRAAGRSIPARRPRAASTKPPAPRRAKASRCCQGPAAPGAARQERDSASAAGFRPRFASPSALRMAVQSDRASAAVFQPHEPAPRAEAPLRQRHREAPGLRERALADAGLTEHSDRPRIVIQHRCDERALSPPRGRRRDRPMEEQAGTESAGAGRRIGARAAGTAGHAARRGTRSRADVGLHAVEAARACRETR